MFLYFTLHSFTPSSFVPQRHRAAGMLPRFSTCSTTGLSGRIEDELTARDVPADLNSLVSLASCVDGHLQERRRGRELSSVPQAQQPPGTIQIGRAHLSTGGCTVARVAILSLPVHFYSYIFIDFLCIHLFVCFDSAWHNGWIVKWCLTPERPVLINNEYLNK